MSAKDRAHYEELLAIYEENVRKLEVQEANFGNQTPLHILIELDQARTNVEAIKRQLNPNDAPASPSDDLQFVNQQEALNIVLSQPQANNFVIDTPAGYGKTRLLKELSIRLTQREWYIRTISFETSHVKPINQHDAISFIARHFDLKHTGTAEEMGRKVAERLRRLSASNQGQHAIGSVLILDSVEHITSTEPGKPYHEIRSF